MIFKVVFTEKALKQLKKSDEYTASLITGRIRKNPENCSAPRLHGKGLVENRSSQWRYRVEDYGIIAEIQDDKVNILVLEIGHRSNSY